MGELISPRHTPYLLRTDSKALSFHEGDRTLLRRIERIDQGETLVIFAAQRTHGFTVEFVNRGLRGGQARRQDIALADNR